MKNDMTSIIELFHKFQSFKEANGITAMTPIQVMSDLSYELNVSAEDLYILATKLIDGIFNSDACFVYGERIDAIRTIAEEGIYISALSDVNPVQAYTYLLQCPPEHFIAIVDEVAKLNQDYYTCDWDYNDEHHKLMGEINESIKAFQRKSSSLAEQIQFAASRTSDGRSSSFMEDRPTSPER